MLTANYHTHTCRCGHADGTVADYCQAALDAGLSVLGITDHTALPDNRWLNVRMDIAELPAYCAEIDAAREAFPKLTVLKGMECEYDEVYHAFFQEELLGRLGFDYLIGAVHWFPHDDGWLGVYAGTTDAATLRSYARHYIATMESGLFSFMAHPDVFGNAYLTWDSDAEACSRDILAAAAARHVPLEINGYGLRKPLMDTPDGPRPMYPWRRFWELAAEFDIEVVVTSDAHSPKDVAGKMDEAEAIGTECGLAFADMSHLAKRAAVNAQ